jgi:hypothetical protein
MNPRADELCKILERSCDLSNAQEIDEFSRAAVELTQHREPSVLRRMLRCFRDADAGEVQYELVETCEQYPAQEYVPAFVDEGERFFRTSPFWFRLMFQSIINSPVHRLAFEEYVRSKPLDIRRFYLERVTDLAKDNPKYGAIAKRLGRG